MEKFPPIPRVFGTVTVGERGQVVIPAAIRKTYQLNAGDRLIVIAGKGGPIGFIPVADFDAFIKHHEQFLMQVKKNAPHDIQQ